MSDKLGPALAQKLAALSALNDTVTIPRAQLEAYQAAAKVLFTLEETEPDFGTSNWRPAHEALAALRAAGIPEGK